MSDIVIIGGGIIGMMTARELSLAGMKVTIIDQGQAGHESSWAGGGIISPLYPWRYSDAVNVLAKWGQNFYPDLIEEMLSETGLDAELVQSGLLMIDADQQTAVKWAKNWQVDLQVIDKNEILELEPELSPVLLSNSNTMWMPEVRQVRNPRLVKTLKQYLLKRNVSFIEQTEVTGLLTGAGKVLGVSSSAGDFKADKVLIAGGAWSTNLLKNKDISVRPVKGQMILYKTNPGTVKRITLSEDRYVIPRRDGRVLVGSTLEHTGFDKSTTLTAREELAKQAARIIPCLQDAQIEHHWAGLRPGSTDGIPYICSVPGLDGLYLNAGHFRNGVVLGPASAHFAADIILNRPLSFDPAPYQIEKA